jgi:hypothetical protein
MSEPHAEDGARHLREDIGQNIVSPQIARDRCCRGNSRVEMRAGDRGEGEDHRDQRAAGSDGVGKESERDVSARQALRHDARADHGDQEERRANALGHSAPDDIGCHGGSALGLVMQVAAAGQLPPS